MLSGREQRTKQGRLRVIQARTFRDLGTALLAAFALNLIAAGPASGQARSKSSPTDVLCERIADVGRAIRAYEQKRKSMLSLLDQLRRTSDALQKRAAGPARDYRLRTVMAEARQMARQLTLLDSRIARLRKTASKLRRRMERLAGKLPKPQARKLTDCIKRAMPSKRAAAVQAGRLAKVKLDPLDGPKEIEEKADLLADSADKLDKRLRSLQRAIRSVERQVALRTAAKRAEGRTALWGSGQPTRLTARTRSTPTVRVNRPGATQGGNPGPQNSFSDDRTDTDGLYSGEPAEASPVAGGTSGGPVSVRTVWERTIGALRGLVDASTAAALTKAMRSGDLATRLAALRKARQILARKTAQLRRRSEQFRRRASELRRAEGKKRSRTR